MNQTLCAEDADRVVSLLRYSAAINHLVFASTQQDEIDCSEDVPWATLFVGDCLHELMAIVEPPPKEGAAA